MYQIEKFLLDHNFKKVREYDSGVIVYGNAEEELEYNTEVAVFTKHHPLVYEIHIRNPYSVYLESNKDYDDKFWEEKLDTHKCLVEDQVEYAKTIYEWLKNKVKDPWKEATE